jgi:predicted RNA-binding protein
MLAKYWIIVASKDHVQNGMRGSFAQANHGKSTPLKRFKKGDWVIFYSSKAEYGKAEKCQCFTAIGQVQDDLVYQAFMGHDFAPFRRNVTFYPSQEIAILPLISKLSFIKDKIRWGGPFRFGMLEIPVPDFDLIFGLMLPEPVRQAL